MATVIVKYERVIDTDADRVFCFLVDFNVTHPRILPKNFIGYRVEEGGIGTGTVISYRFRVGGRERPYRMRIEADSTTRWIIERDLASSLATRWDFVPEADSRKTRVRLCTTWDGSSGLGGFFERIFAPIALRRVYKDEVDRLERALAEQMHTS